MSATPIIPGFHPDPSICRVGEDYYLVNSSFEYLPGVPIFHSRDLVTWELIGNVLDREDQFSLDSSAGSSGIFAPTIRHHDGRFWMITTCINTVRDGHLIVSATDPAGPWTDPVYTTGAFGIDPDLFWDVDGTCYLTWAGGWGGDIPIMQVPIDPATGALLGEPKGISGGTGLAHPEGPHIYRRGGWYYLLLAEGGTERGHTVTISRSRSVNGPYEGDPANPILSHRSSTDPVQNTGHADLVEAADGWAMVFLGVRPVGPSPLFHLNGRETFIAGVEWSGDWPVVDESRFEVPPWSGDIDDDFSSALDARWIAPGPHPRVFTSAAPGGGIEIRHPESGEQRALLATRVEHSAWDARATVAAGSARLVLRSDDAHWVAVESAGGGVSARGVVGPFDQVLGSAPASGEATVVLAIRSSAPPAGVFGMVSTTDTLDLGVIVDDEFRTLASLDGRYLSTEVAGGFTGRVIGVEPLPGVSEPAILRRFEYLGRGDAREQGAVLGGGEGIDEASVDEVDDSVHAGQVDEVVGDEQG